MGTRPSTNTSSRLKGSKSDRPAEVKVGFFNHSDRDIVLEVNGETLQAAERAVRDSAVDSAFSWAEKGRRPPTWQCRRTRMGWRSSFELNDDRRMTHQ